MCAITAIYNYHYAAPEINGQELCIIRDHMSARGRILLLSGLYKNN